MGLASASIAGLILEGWAVGVVWACKDEAGAIIERVASVDGSFGLEERN